MITSILSSSSPGSINIASIVFSSAMIKQVTSSGPTQTFYRLALLFPLFEFCFPLLDNIFQFFTLKQITYERNKKQNFSIITPTGNLRFPCSTQLSTFQELLSEAKTSLRYPWTTEAKDVFKKTLCNFLA